MIVYERRKRFCLISVIFDTAFIIEMHDGKEVILICIECKIIL